MTLQTVDTNIGKVITSRENLQEFLKEIREAKELKTVETNIGQIIASRETLQELKDIVLCATVTDIERKKDKSLSDESRNASELSYERHLELWNDLYNSLA